MIYCTKCGKANADDDRYCFSCGAVLRRDEAQAESGVDAAAKDSAAAADNNTNSERRIIRAEDEDSPVSLRDTKPYVDLPFTDDSRTVSSDTGEYYEVPDADAAGITAASSKRFADGSRAVHPVAPAAASTPKPQPKPTPKPQPVPKISPAPPKPKRQPLSRKKLAVLITGCTVALAVIVVGIIAICGGFSDKSDAPEPEPTEDQTPQAGSLSGVEVLLNSTTYRTDIEAAIIAAYNRRGTKYTTCSLTDYADLKIGVLGTYGVSYTVRDSDGIVYEGTVEVSVVTALSGSEQTPTQSTQQLTVDQFYSVVNNGYWFCQSNSSPYLYLHFSTVGSTHYVTYDVYFTEAGSAASQITKIVETGTTTFLLSVNYEYYDESCYDSRGNLVSSIYRTMTLSIDLAERASNRITVTDENSTERVFYYVGNTADDVESYFGR